MTIDREGSEGSLIGRLPEKFQSIMQEALAASGKSASKLIEAGHAAPADSKEGGVKVTFPGNLDLTRHPEITADDLPSFLIVEKDLVVSGDQFFSLDDKGVQVDGNIRIKNFDKAIPKTPGQSTEEYLQDQFESWNRTSLGGKIVLE